jgi:hypothetical protein
VVKMSPESEIRQCANCGTTRHTLRARHLCGRCLYAQRKLEQADEEVSHGFPEGYKQECRNRLTYLKIAEQKRSGPISGLDIEHELNWLARRAGGRNRKPFNGVAEEIDFYFKPKQRTVLYCLLSDIKENIPWAGVDWHRVASGSPK